MTLHTAKGLEFDNVFLTGFEDGVFPHERALADPEELEEERRLAYVGITRARQRLYLTRAIARTLWGAPSYNPASRFLDEIPTHLLDWRRLQPLDTWSVRTTTTDYAPRTTKRTPIPEGMGRTSRLIQQTKERPKTRVKDLAQGDLVMHPKFGLGKVLTVTTKGDDTQAKIDFGSYGEKLLSLAYAPLEKL
jgi:DNA helicase-2/ATP-dependent DNA helicase PcrA